MVYRIFSILYLNPWSWWNENGTGKRLNFDKKRFLAKENICQAVFSSIKLFSFDNIYHNQENTKQLKNEIE